MTSDVSLESFRRLELCAATSEINELDGSLRFLHTSITAAQTVFNEAPVCAFNFPGLERHGECCRKGVHLEKSTLLLGGAVMARWCAFSLPTVP